MENKLINEITNECLRIISEQYNNDLICFYSWISFSSDYEFTYIYEQIFKKYYLKQFKIETGAILSYYAVNLAHALLSFYEIDTDTCKLSNFIKKFINSQFKNMDIDQLYLD